MDMIKKLTIPAICILALTSALAVPVNAAQVIRWGLRYEKPGDTPIGNAPPEYLEKFNTCFFGYPKDGEKTLYLTFDAGYENGHTEKILDILNEKNVPATFFLLGPYLKNNPDIVNRKISEGHIIGNHTMSHDDMSKKGPEGLASELKQFEELYKSLFGTEAKKYYRPPEGAFSESNLITANELGYKTILWSATYADWDNKKQPSREQAFEKLMPRLHDGGIVLLHSTSATSAAILSEFIDRCHQQGYTFKSLDEL
jgi:peptidoglycan-N-acetylmuramic acid deacetylase